MNELTALMHEADAELARKRTELQQLTERGAKEREEQRQKLVELNRRISDVQDNARLCEAQLADLSTKTEEAAHVRSPSRARSCASPLVAGQGRGGETGAVGKGAAGQGAEYGGAPEDRRE